MTSYPVPENLDIHIAHHIQDISPETWQRYDSGQPFCSHAWYRFVERVLPCYRPLYLLADCDGQPAGRATFWVVHDEPLPVPPPARWVLDGLIRRWPLLVCRSPIADAGGISLAPGAPAAATLQALFTTAGRCLTQQRGSFLIFDFVPEALLDLSWPSQLARARVSDPGTLLELQDDNFEDYLKHLTRPAYKDYRRHRNQAERLGIQVVACRQPESIAEALPLIRGVERRHGSAPKPWAPDLLAAAGQADATWLEARIGPRLVGCGLLLRDGPTQMMTLLGLDDTVEYVYFQLVYAAIRCACEHNVRWLRGGSGAYELKKRLGFRLENDNFIFFSGRGGLLQTVGRWLSAKIL